MPLPSYACAMAVAALSRLFIAATATTESDRARARWLLAGIIVLGAAIRFSTLDQQSFWLDEATTWGLVSHGLGHVLSTVPKTESTPPLYYVMVWLWAQVFEAADFGLEEAEAHFFAIAAASGDASRGAIAGFVAVVAGIDQ